jgi:hypothetical protein
MLPQQRYDDDLINLSTTMARDVAFAITDICDVGVHIRWCTTVRRCAEFEHLIAGGPGIELDVWVYNNKRAEAIAVVNCNHGCMFKGLWNGFEWSFEHSGKDISIN